MSEQSAETPQPDFENDSIRTWRSAVESHDKIVELSMEVINILHVETEAHRLRPTVFALAFGYVETGAPGTETDRVLREFLSAVNEFNASVDFANLLGNTELLDAILKLEGADIHGNTTPGRVSPSEPEAH